MANYNGGTTGKTNGPSDPISGTYTLREQSLYEREGTWAVSEPISSGLLLYLDAGNPSSYPGSGITWVDLSGNGYDATLNGPTYSSVDGGSIVFDGSGDYVGVSSIDTTLNALISGSNDFSVSYWFNPDSFPPSTYYTFAYVLFNAGPRSFYLVFGDSAPVNQFSVRTNQGGTWRSVVQNNSALSINTWYNMVVTYSSSTGFILYQNGTSVDTSSQNGTFSTSGDNPAIGALNGGERFYDGKISQVLIYDKKLTASEVTQNFDTFKGRYGL